MAIVTWPSDVRIAAFDAGLEFDVQFNIALNGSITTYGLPGARWFCTLTFPPEAETIQRPKLEALLVSLEGGASRLQMHHWGRPMPNGTMRGSPTVNASTAAGLKQIQLANVNGTLLRGD